MKLVREIIEASLKNYGSAYILQELKKEEKTGKNTSAKSGRKKQKNSVLIGKKISNDEAVLNSNSLDFTEIKKPAISSVPLTMKNTQFEPNK